MKKKTILVALLCVMGLAALSIGNAEAAPPWYNCTISQAGANWTANYVVTLSDTATPPAFTNRQFIIDIAAGKQKEMYAAALTAFANSTYVLVYINPPASAGFKVQAIYATK